MLERKLKFPCLCQHNTLCLPVQQPLMSHLLSTTGKHISGNASRHHLFYKGVITLPSATAYRNFFSPTTANKPASHLRRNCFVSKNIPNTCNRITAPYSTDNSDDFSTSSNMKPQMPQKPQSTSVSDSELQSLYELIPSQRDVMAAHFSKVPSFRQHDHFAIHCANSLTKKWRSDSRVLHPVWTWSDTMRSMYTFDLLKQILKDLRPERKLRLEVDDQVRIHFPPHCRNEILVKDDEDGCVLVCVEARSEELWESALTIDGTQQLMLEMASVGEQLARHGDISENVMNVYGFVTDFQRYQPFVFVNDGSNTFYRATEQYHLPLTELFSSESIRYESVLPVVSMIEFMLRSYEDKIQWEDYLEEKKQ